jgi:hypothetical protein
MRSSLFAAVALGPLCLVAVAFPAKAQLSITASQATPVATATASNNAPADISITSSGVVQPTAATSPAVTLNSNNKITNAGAITFNNVSGSTSVLIQGGFTGSLTNSGSINNIEDFSPPDSNIDGVVESPLASGNTRYGVRVTGTAPFVGTITNTGSIFVEGNDSAGISIEAPLTGAVVEGGTIGVTGDRSFGLRTTAPITGTVSLSGPVSTSGQGATAVSIGADVSGAVSVYSAVSSNGFATSARSITDTTLKTIQGTASEQLLSGPALVIGGNIGRGLYIGAPPVGTAAGATVDADADGVPDGSEGSGSLSSFGSSPAVLIGGTGRAVTLGAFGTGANNFGLIMRGAVNSNGLYDGISATGVQIGGTGSAASLVGGFRLTGTVSASAYEAAATGIRIGAGGSVPLFQNENTVVSSILHSSLATATTATATALLIQPGGNLPRVINYGTIAATGAGTVVSASAIVDQSGTLTSFTNQGLISASLTAATTGGTTGGRTIALDLSANTSGVSLVQSVNPAPIVLSGTVGANGAITALTSTPFSPSIIGDVLLGNGPNTVQLLGGSVTGALSLGSGASSLTINNGATYTGALTHTGPNLVVTVTNGTLTNTSPIAIQASSLNVGATGAISIAIDPANKRAGSFLVSGPANIASGAKVGINLVSGVTAAQTFTLVSSPQLNVGSLASIDAQVPYLTIASLSLNNAIGTLSVNLRQRTAAEAGLNAAETAALQSVLAALPGDATLQSALFSKADRAGFIGFYDQLLPDYSGGVFRLASVASRAVSRATSDADGPWLQEITVGTRLKSGNGAAPFHGLGLGVSGGLERNASIGVFGVTGSLFTGDLRLSNSPGDNRASESQLEGGFTWRTDLGGLRLDGRAAAGFVSYNYRRELKVFDSTGTVTVLDRLANGKSNGYSVAGHFGGSYRAQGGRWYLQPEAHVDYFRLTEGSYTETGGGAAFNATIAKRIGAETSATVSVRAGGSFGSDFTWRPELEFGYREIVSGGPGTTTASFNRGTSFTLNPADIQRGGAFGRFGFAAGNELYDLSIAAGAEMRGGYAEGDLHVRVRLLF